MKVKNLNLFVLLCLTSFMACSQNQESESNKLLKSSNQIDKTIKNEPHNFGGWYCPDNLNGFPAVDLKNWKSVPVISDRLPTKAETKSSASLIYIDTLKYPDASSLNLYLPRLAKYYSQSTKREDLIIVIQAIRVGTDSIVGFRYLNGGNGSARIREVNFMTENEIELPSSAQFVTLDINIQAKAEKVWEILLKPEHTRSLLPTSTETWPKTSKVNFYYPGSGKLRNAYANLLYGNFYAQNDYDSLNYSEKFLLLEDQESGVTELKIVIGPFTNDYEKQKGIILAWSKRLKDLSEKD